jgi:hypothetical protein
MIHERFLDGTNSTISNVTTAVPLENNHNNDRFANDYWLLIVNMVVLFFAIFVCCLFYYHHAHGKDVQFNPFVFGSQSSSNHQLTPYEEGIIRREKEKHLKYIENTDQRKKRIQCYFDRNDCRMVRMEFSVF